MNYKRSPTSNLLFKSGNESDSLLQYGQLGLRLVGLLMYRDHTAELLERIVDVTYSNPEQSSQTDAPTSITTQSNSRQFWHVITLEYLTLWRPLLPYGYSYKVSCARMG